MIYFRDKQQKESELVGMRALLAEMPDDPLSKPLLESRIQDFESDLAKIEKQQVLAPETELLFSGSGVIGSLGIDAKLASRVLDSYQDMMINHHAASRHGSVGSKGRRAGEQESRLYLSGLPRGSFGLLLAQPCVEDFIVAGQIAGAMEEIIELIDASGAGDVAFTEAISRFHPRVLKPLERLLEALDSQEVEVKIRSGSRQASLRREKVREAHLRVADAKSETKDITLIGTFRGVLLESWKFDFVPEDGRPISGNLSESVTEDEAKNMADLVDEKTEAKLSCTRIVTRSGEGGPSYELTGLHKIA